MHAGTDKHSSRNAIRTWNPGLPGLPLLRRAVRCVLFVTTGMRSTDLLPSAVLRSRYFSLKALHDSAAASQRRLTPPAWGARMGTSSRLGDNRLFGRKMNSANTSDGELVELMVVEQLEICEDIGVFVRPEFPLRSGGQFEDFSFIAVVEDPEGRREKRRAALHPIHYLFKDRSGQKFGEWRLRLLIHRATKQDVPIGSRVLCNLTAKDRIVGPAQ